MIYYDDLGDDAVRNQKKDETIHEFQMMMDGDDNMPGSSWFFFGENDFDFYGKPFSARGLVKDRRQEAKTVAVPTALTIVSTLKDQIMYLHLYLYLYLYLYF